MRIAMAAANPAPTPMMVSFAYAVDCFASVWMTECVGDDVGEWLCVGCAVWLGIIVTISAFPRL
jgi:hypothetical protein